MLRPSVHRPLALLKHLPALLLALSVGGAAAQATDKLSDAERARRDAEKVFSFIKFQTVKPAADAKPAAKPAAAASKPAAVVAAARPPAVPASRPVAAGVTDVVTNPVLSAAAEPPLIAGADLPASASAGAPPPSVILPVTLPVALPSSAPSAEPAPAVEEEAEVPLKLIAYVAPELNAQVLAAMDGSQVVVPVRFVVQADGRVRDVRSSGPAPRRVANAAVRAVQQWRFDAIPALREVDVELVFKPGE